MAAVHIRNVRVDMNANYTFVKCMVFMWREAALVAGWQIIYDGGNSAWTDPANVYLELSDVALDSLAATEVYSATGGFTSGMVNKIISIYGNDQNRGMYNIKRYIDTNTILIDQRCRVAAWADETGISVKVHNGGVGAPPESGNVTIAPPSGTSRLCRFNMYAGSGNATTYYTRVDPKGNGLYAATTTYTVGYSTQDLRWNAFFADDLASHFYMLYAAYDGAANWQSACFGEVSSRAVADTGSGFTQQLCDGTDWSVGLEAAMQSTNDLDATIACYPMFYKDGQGVSADSMRERANLAQKINGGRAKTFRPLIMAENSPEGGFIRGIHPMEFCHSGWPNFEEFAGAYWKMGSNILIPKNGASDPVPLASVAA